MNVKVKPVDLYNIESDDIRSVGKMIDQTYWADNGGETDGPSYLIEVSEFTPEQAKGLNLPIIEGTYLDKYDFDLHSATLYNQRLEWTGWQAEGYALIVGSPAFVQHLFSIIPVSFFDLEDAASHE